MINSKKRRDVKKKTAETEQMRERRKWFRKLDTRNGNKIIFVNETEIV